MLLVTYARRLGAALTALDVLAATAPAGAAAQAEAEAYVASAVEAAAAHLQGERREGALPAPEPVGHAALARVVRQAELVASYRRPLAT
jgi:hypothetical protein